MRCAVSNCGNNNRHGNRKKWRYFHFPKNEQQLQKWVQFCQREIVNTSTACICNVHFTPDDFERNMQYELGFTRKNPTKLKPGSFPTIRGPQDKLLRSAAKTQLSNVPKATQCLKTVTQFTEIRAEEADTLEPLTLDGELKELPDSLSNLDQDIDIIDYISESEDSASSHNKISHVTQMELEIIDPYNPHISSDQHIEIIDSENEQYVKHLECEVSLLKRQVFFLKDERKQLIDEIQNLRATVRNARLQPNSMEKGKKVNKLRIQPSTKKTVLLYTANIETIKKLDKFRATE